MKKWLKHLFSRQRTDNVHSDLSASHPVNASPPVADHILAQLTESQTLRIELQACEQEILVLRQDIERLRSRQDQMFSEKLRARLNAIFEDLSGPATQILTLVYLLEQEQKPLQARDVLTVAHRMVRMLERQGLVFEGKVGNQVLYDPDRHTPIGEEHISSIGQPVTIRFAGTSFEGKIIRKAGIE